MIELYIENKKIDLTDDLEVNFTYETIDPDKLSSIKNSFSKTVNIPGTANNNITFGHIFRYDKYIPLSGPVNIDNYYDPHKRVKWFINKNGSLVNRGYCVLDNILIKSERDITYQLTLYGGLGEFFYSLSYNEDGSPKTLADMFWNWFPRTSLYSHGNALDPGEESTQTLYKASASIVASSYHSLNPLYTYEGTTDIDKDVVFVPCYTGLYEDFDSKHMLVSTFNQRYTTTPKCISDEKKNLLQNSFPDTYTDSDGTIYTTLDKNFSSSGAYKYGLVTLSRDIDPWEAGDIRVNELPVAIRLSKLMHVISQPENNGGYEVIWDDDIKQSLHWLYSWVLLGKLKQKKEDIVKYSLVPNPTYDGQNLTVNYSVENQGAATTSTTITYDLFNSTIDQGTYAFTLNVVPKLNFNVNNLNDYWSGRNAIYDWVSASYTISASGHNILYYSRWNTFVVINKFYLGSTTIKTICDVFYFAQNANRNRFGEVTYGNYNSQFLDNLKTMLETHYYISIDKIEIHNCEALYSDYNGDQNLVPTINYEVQNQQISTTLEISTAGSLRIEQTQVMCFTIGGYYGPRSGIWGVDVPTFAVGDSSKLGFFGFVINNNKTDARAWNTVEDYSGYSCEYNFSITINESKQNGLAVSKSSGFNIMNVDKKTLFANSKSPMSYLSGFCKIMNYRFVCDNVSQKIYIHTLKDYYKNRIIGLDDRLDIGRSINIKNLTTKNKRINVGLDTPETYPVNLFNKNSREKFNIYRYETGIEFPAGEANLLDGLTFKNTIDWQQSSIFYNIYPQMPRPYATQSISWTLFNPESASTNEIKKKEIFTVGVPSTVDTMIANIDFLPKLSLFDKDNKFVDVESSLIFLNGFVKNYDYTSLQSEDVTYWVISPKVMFSNDTYEQYYLNQSRCYMYDFKYNDTFVSWGEYSIDQKGSATSWVIPMFSRDLYNAYIPYIQKWNSSTYKLASWNISNQEGLDTQYSLIGTKFVFDTNYSYSKIATENSYLANEYSIASIPNDDNEFTERIYDKNWKDYMKDLYDRNARDITAYVDLSGLGDATQIMRNIYSYKSHLWVITKLENFKISETTHDKFTKVTMHKIDKLSTWTN